jgi:DNA modification methylase
MDKWLNRIICGNCMEVMQEMPDSTYDAVITDPPFAFTGGISNGRSACASVQFFSFWWRAVCKELVRVLKPTGSGFIWCDWKTAKVIADGFEPKVQTHDFWRVAQMLYHYRQMPGMGQPFRSSVDMIVYVRGPKHRNPPIPATTHNLLSMFWPYGKHRNHPAEKSPEMVRQLLEWCTEEGQTVIDPFAGSAVVGLTAREMGREWTCIESDEEFARNAMSRLQCAEGGRQ